MFVFRSLFDMKSWQDSGQEPISALPQPCWVPHAYIPIVLHL